MCYVWRVFFILEAPLGPPMGGGVGFMGLISLMREPIGAPLPREGLGVGQ